MDEAIDVIRNIMNTEIAGLVSLCLKSTYLSYRGLIYELNHGVAMGSPMSSMVANVYMEKFELKVLKSFPLTLDE